MQPTIILLEKATRCNNHDDLLHLIVGKGGGGGGGGHQITPTTSPSRPRIKHKRVEHKFHIFEIIALNTK